MKMFMSAVVWTAILGYVAFALFGLIYALIAGPR